MDRNVLAQIVPVQVSGAVHGGDDLGMSNQGMQLLPE
jgi:hypothetical protein